MPQGVRRRAWSLPSAIVATLIALAGLLAAGCTPAGRSTPMAEDPRRPTITVTSFDFTESQVLAELYAQAMRAKGYPVEIVPALGPREIVQPALEQGRVDFVVGYLGSGVNFLYEQRRVATADVTATFAKFARALADRGITALAFAPAEDRNGFVVTGDLARRRGLRQISDLRPIARQLTLGGPSECPNRVLCLRGLHEVYGLRFKAFEPTPSRAMTANALEAGEIQVGMIETTDGNLADHDLVQLADDRHLQPPENVVPIMRSAMVKAYGPALVRLVNAVTARLTTDDLIVLNGQVDRNEASPQAAAAAWLREHPVDGQRG